MLKSKMQNYKINLGFDSLVAQYVYNNPDVPPLMLYSLPGWDQGDYLHTGFNPEEKDELPGDKDKNKDLTHIFNRTKNELEEEFNIKLPILVSKGRNLPKSRYTGQLFDDRFIATGIHHNFGIDMVSFSYNNNVDVEFNTASHYINNNINFIYPYQVGTSDFYTKADIPLPPPDVIQAAKNNLCKICFFYGIEGHITEWAGIEKFKEFSEKIGTDIYLYHSNLMLKDSTIPGVHTPEYCYFEVFPWSILIDRSNHEDIYNYSSQFKIKVEEHKLVKNFLNKDSLKKFLVFNRRPRPHRTLLHAAMSSDDSIRDNSYLSLGKNRNISAVFTFLNESTVKVYKRRKIDSFIRKNFNIYKEQGFTLDANLDVNQANSMPYSLFYNSLISVVTETEADKEGTIFLTEKIFKPIVGLHPFIVLGNKHTLRKLREYGYKTFSNYWDESYDNEPTIAGRFNKVFKLIEELNAKPLEELKEMYFDMEKILKHNHSILIKNNRSTLILNEITNFKNTSLKHTVLNNQDKNIFKNLI